MKLNFFYRWIFQEEDSLENGWPSKKEQKKWLFMEELEEEEVESLPTRKESFESKISKEHIHYL